MLLYNYINDPIESIIFDTRNRNNLKSFPIIPSNSRLILILRDYEDIKTSKDLEFSEIEKNIIYLLKKEEIR